MALIELPQLLDPTTQHFASLHCTVIHITALLCTVEHYNNFLHTTSPQSTTIDCNALHCTPLLWHWTKLHGAVLFTALYCSTLHCIALPLHRTLHFTAPCTLHFTTSCYITLHWSFHCTSLLCSSTAMLCESKHGAVRYTTLHISLHGIAPPLHCSPLITFLCTLTTLHFTALHCSVVHPTPQHCTSFLSQRLHLHLHITTDSSRLKLGFENWVEWCNVVVNNRLPLVYLLKIVYLLFSN